MMKVFGRLERLEEAILPPPDTGPPEVMTVHFVDSDKRVVSTLEFEMGHARPPKRRWGSTAGRSRPSI